jgi:hypothetical protein
MTTPTDILAFEIYQFALYPVTGWAVVSGYLQNRFPLTGNVFAKAWDSALIRAALIVTIGQWLLIFWNRLSGYVPGQGMQLPIVPMATVALASAVLMQSRPAGKLNAIIGALFAAAVLFCIIATINLANGGSLPVNNIVLWRSSLVSGLCILLVMAGASSGKTGVAVISYLGRCFDALVRRLNPAKLAR